MARSRRVWSQSVRIRGPPPSSSEGVLSGAGRARGGGPRVDERRGRVEGSSGAVRTPKSRSGFHGGCLGVPASSTSVRTPPLRSPRRGLEGRVRGGRTPVRPPWPSVYGDK